MAARNDPNVQIAPLNQQMSRMQAMHARMLRARSVEERQVLIAEHLQVVPDSMAMMREMDALGRIG
jgi:hypothetical protein